MQWKVSTIALIGLSALCVTGCSVQRTALRSEVRSQTAEVVRDTVREQVMVAVLDSVTITKTITITENEQGDTVRLIEVTDRDRVRDRAAVRDKEEKVMVKTDTVYVECRDSVYVSQKPQIAQKSASPLSYLKWVFWIVVAVTVLIVVIKLAKVFRV